MWNSASVCMLFIVVVACMCSTTSSSLEVGFYKWTCPSAEAIVRSVVNRAINRDVGLGAALLRLHYHDCFVRGCDASILLDSTPWNPAEKDHMANNPSLRGYEVIDWAKAQLEAQCPQTVSCADILAFAARDSAQRLGGINYDVPSGRRDGRISLIDDPSHNLPSTFFNLQQLQQNFASKGLSLEEMVILSGAHSVGVSHCSSITNRLYSFNATHPQDPSIDHRYADYLKMKCPINNNVDGIVFQDGVTPHWLDNKYYQNVLNRKSLLVADQTLMSSPETVRMVRRYNWKGGLWARKFGQAMAHMGYIEVLTGQQGEIRKNCRVIN